MRVEFQIESSGGRQAAAADAAVVRLGRDPECEVRFDAAAYPKVSGLHAQFESSGNGLIIRHVSRSNATLLNGKAIDGAATIKRGDVLRLGYTGPEIRLVQFGPSPAAAPPVIPPPANATQDDASSFPVWLWAGVAGLAVAIATGVVMYRSMGGGAVAAADAPPKPEPTAIEPRKATAQPPTSSPSDAERLKNAVVSVGLQVDGVYIIECSGILITPEHVITSADMARFIDGAIKETPKDKKAFDGKSVTPAIRHAGGMVRLRKLVADPKYDPLKPETSLGHNLAVGVLDRSLTELAVWPTLKEATNALVNAAMDNPGVVDAIVWDGKGTDALQFRRTPWPGLAVQGADTGPNGEFMAFHLAEEFPGSAAGGPVFKDGRWQGVLFRHPSPTDPKKKIWKFVGLDFVVPLLIQEGK